MYLSPLSWNRLVKEKSRTNMVAPWGWKLAPFNLVAQLANAGCCPHPHDP